LHNGYLDELSLFKATDKKVLVGLSTDGWNIGQKKYRETLAVHKMAKRIQKHNIACVEIPMWEIAQGPHYDDLQKLFESFWIPDFTNTDNFLMQFDLVVIPDPVIAKYMVESFYEKEAKLEKKKSYYDKLQKQPWGVIDSYPPRERYEYERVKGLGVKQRWMRKFPPMAVCGDESYRRIKIHGQVEYFSHGVEDFALYLPEAIVPTRRVLLLRFKNRFETLNHSLRMKGINVTSAYPVTWVRKEWSPQEERLAKEVDVVYLHEVHNVNEWRDRMQYREKDAVAACHDEDVARAAKEAGFKDIFYAKNSNTEGLTKTVIQAVEHVKRMAAEKNNK
jgi:uroporphyrinogen-III synthase